MLICKNCIFAKKIITYRYIIVNIAKAQSVFTTLISVKVLLLQQNWFHLQIERINKKTGNKNKRIFRKKHIHPLKQPREYWGGAKGFSQVEGQNPIMISLDFLRVLVYNAAMLEWEMCFFVGQSGISSLHLTPKVTPIYAYRNSW